MGGCNPLQGQHWQNSGICGIQFTCRVKKLCTELKDNNQSMVCVPCCFIKLLFVFQAVLLPKKDIISLVLPGIFGAVHNEFRVKGVHTNDSGKYFN